MEIFICDLFFKDSKKHSYRYFKSLDGARCYAVSCLGYKNVIVRIYPEKLYA